MLYNDKAEIFCRLKLLQKDKEIDILTKKMQITLTELSCPCGQKVEFQN